MSEQKVVPPDVEPADLERLYRVGLALGSERDGTRLVERILLEAKALANADGGTVYLRSEDDTLEFAILRSDSLDLALGGTTGNDIRFSPIPLWDPRTGAENHRHVAAHAVHVGRPVHVPDAYAADGFDLSGTHAFDRENGYRTRSLLALPLESREGRVIGVLQLVNARDETGRVIPFPDRHAAVAEALAAQAAVALDAQQLYDGQRRLLEAFLELLAGAIDAKSPYTGGHCRRVPVLAELLVKAMTEAEDGPYREFQLTKEEWYELHIAAWLHDCGKVTTPPHVMDKATKLEGIHDGLEIIRARFAAAALEAEHESTAAGPGEARAALAADFAVLERLNPGAESVNAEDLACLERLAARRYRDLDGVHRPLLLPEEVEKLSVSRGTLTDAERLVINGHMVQTVLMLESLPFPRNLRRVPEYACGHHERMNGEGYPRGIFGGDMSLPARAMAIADVFEALTAGDRPYKKAMSLSQAMAIMGRMKVTNHLDPVMFDFFVSSGVYREYARRYLPEALLDPVDEAALLALEPEPFRLPPKAERDERWERFSPPYAFMAPKAVLRRPSAGNRGGAF